MRPIDGCKVFVMISLLSLSQLFVAVDLAGAKPMPSIDKTPTATIDSIYSRTFAGQISDTIDRTHLQGCAALAIIALSFLSQRRRGRNSASPDLTPQQNYKSKPRVAILPSVQDVTPSAEVKSSVQKTTDKSADGANLINTAELYHLQAKAAPRKRF